MDINNISNNLQSKINDSKSVDPNEKSGAVSSKNNDQSVSDKVSIDQSRFSKNEVLFAKIELAKHNDASFEKLKSIKASLTEYENAKAESEEKAGETAIGKMINDSNIWEEIARKMV